MIEDQRGPIARRSLAHLVRSDESIMRVRCNILQAAKDLQQGIELSLVQNPEGSLVFPMRMVLPSDADVDEALRPHLGPTASD